jgi:hypothetical protein
MDEACSTHESLKNLKLFLRIITEGEYPLKVLTGENM